MRKLLPLILVVGSVVLLPTPAQAAVSFTQNQWGINFTNADGTWVVYTGCFGPVYRGGTNLTVGPGYIARVIRTDGVKIVEDETPLRDAQGNLLSGGGLGGFGFHLARGVSPFTFNGNNAWPVEGRFCKEDLPFGVQRATVLRGPVQVSPTRADLDMDVYFQDWCNRDILRVRYKYQVLDSVVKVWTLVTELDDGCFANGGYAWVKEPKFFARVLPADYTRLMVYKADNTPAQNVAHGDNPESTWCTWLGANPTVATRQCENDQRARFRWDFGTGTDPTLSPGNCSTTNLCLTAIGRAYAGGSDITPGGATSNWEKSGLGIDQWAAVSAGRTKANTQDGPGGGTNPGTCNRVLNGELERRWELTGGPGWGGFTALFHGWEGGTGPYDCEPQSVRFGSSTGSPGESWGMHFEYSINDGWSLQ